MNSPLSGADSTDYSRWFVCSTVDHALFPAQEQGKSTAETTKLKPSVVFCPPATERPIALMSSVAPIGYTTHECNWPFREPGGQKTTFGFSFVVSAADLPCS